MAAILNINGELQFVLKLLSYLRTHWWLVLLEIVVTIGASLWTFSRAQPVYQSSATLLIDSTRASVAQAVGIPGAGSMNSSTKRQNIAYLLTSREAYERFRAMLTDAYNVEGRPAYLRHYFPGGVAVSTDALRSLVTLNWDRKSDIYTVSCRAVNSDAAYRLCLNYLNAMEVFYPEVGQRDVMLRRDFIHRQIKSYTRQIQEGVQNLSAFQKRYAQFIEFVMKSLDESGYRALKQELNTLKQKNDSNRAIRRVLLASPSAKRGEQTSAATAIDALTARISELKYQIELTRVSKSPDREARLRALEAEQSRISSQLGGLNEEQVQNFVRNPLNSAELRTKISELELEYKTNAVAIASIEKQMEQLKANEARFQPQRLEYERLQADIAQKRSLLSTLYIKEQEAELQLSAGGAEIYRLTEPNRASFRTSPQLTKHVVAGISLSILFSILTLLVLTMTMPRLDSEAEVNALNLPVLGKVPAMSIPSDGVLEEVPSTVFEYLRIMNYRILRETKDLRCPVVVVSSSNSREGKSTLVQLMSLASQAPGRKTLLIDGDLLTHHPNKFFNIEEDYSEGVKGILEGKVQGNSSELITKTLHEGIYLLPRGGRIEPSLAPNFLDPLKAQLEMWRKDFNIIFIDTPPLFAANLAHQFTSLGDLIILVARLFVTRPKDILESMATTKVFSKAPIGVALNGISLSGAAKKASNYYFSKRKTRPNRLAA